MTKNIKDIERTTQNHHLRKIVSILKDGLSHIDLLFCLALSYAYYSVAVPGNGDRVFISKKKNLTLKQYDKKKQPYI
jgi:hypothetical protein